MFEPVADKEEYFLRSFSGFPLFFNHVKYFTFLHVFPLPGYLFFAALKTQLHYTARHNSLNNSLPDEFKCPGVSPGINQ